MARRSASAARRSSEVRVAPLTRWSNAADGVERPPLANAGSVPVQTFSAFLDLPEFNGAAYEDATTTYLRGKYAARPPQAIVAVSDEALDFLVRHRAELFPGVPVVFTDVFIEMLRSIPSLPNDVVGVPVQYDYSGTIVPALLWQPAARKLVVITGASARDKAAEARLHREIPRTAGPTISVEYWSGLPTASLQQRLGKLAGDTIVFTPGYFQDGDGTWFSPRDAAALIAAASTAPVYGPLETFIGLGVVGGRMPSFEDMGMQAGRIVNELLAGIAPTALKLSTFTPIELHVDWRQIRRWGIDESLIPEKTVKHFKPPTWWEAYRTEALIALSIIVLQALLIAALFIDRRQRRAAAGAAVKT
jgi:hypothetical protein